LACAVALSVLDEIAKLNVREIGDYFMRQLRTLPVKEVRGIGLMIGVELSGESKPVIAKMAEQGMLGIPAGTNVVRFLPALNATRAEVDEAVRKFKEAL
jgi:acetylornithine/succinyldiaminopimelate/putrescine aminotransferase